MEKNISFKNFSEAVMGFNAEAFYILQIPVNIYSTNSEDSIEQIWAICPIRKTLFSQTFFTTGETDNIRDVSFEHAEQILSEVEFAQILAQLNSNMFELNEFDYELHYDGRVAHKLILTLAVEIESPAAFDINQLNIENIVFKNNEVSVKSYNLDIIEKIDDEDGYDEDDEYIDEDIEYIDEDIDED